MEIIGNKEIAGPMGKALEKGGINIISISSFGKYIHIDTYKKYSSVIKEILIQSGWKVISARDGLHIDKFKGMRISAIFTSESVNKRIV